VLPELGNPLGLQHAAVIQLPFAQFKVEVAAPAPDDARTAAMATASLLGWKERTVTVARLIIQFLRK
jgi:hypothetical protein